MSIQVTNSRYAGLSPDEADGLARRAVLEFYKLKPTLVAYAQSVTKRRDVKLQLVPSGPPRTDGRTIFYAPPLALGDTTPHQNELCARRDPETLRQLCYACHIRDAVLADIFHEIGHIVGDSFVEVTDFQKEEAIRLALKEAPSQYADLVRKRLEGDVSFWAGKGYKVLAGVISRWLPHFYNSLEDARVNALIFREREGMRTIFAVNERETFEEGSPVIDKMTGESKMFSWRDADPSVQMIGAIYVLASGYTEIDGWFSPEVLEALGDPVLKSITGRVATSATAQDTFHIGFAVLDRLRELGFCKLPDDPTPPSPEEDSQEEDNCDVGSGEGSSVSESTETDGGDTPPESESPGGASEGDDADDESGDREGGTPDEGGFESAPDEGDGDSPDEPSDMDSPGGSGDEDGAESDGEAPAMPGDADDMGPGGSGESGMESDDSDASEDGGEAGDGVSEHEGNPSGASQEEDLGTGSGDSGSQEAQPSEAGGDSDTPRRDDSASDSTRVPLDGMGDKPGDDELDSGGESRPGDMDIRGSGGEEGDYQDTADSGPDRDSADGDAGSGELTDDERGDASPSDAGEADSADGPEGDGEGDPYGGLREGPESEGLEGERQEDSDPGHEDNPYESLRGDEGADESDSSEASGPTDGPTEGGGGGIPGASGGSIPSGESESSDGSLEEVGDGDDLSESPSSGSCDESPESGMGDGVPEDISDGGEAEEFKPEREPFDLDDKLSEELSQALEKLFGHHDESEDTLSDADKLIIEAALAMAIGQIEYFDHSSRNIRTLNERTEFILEGKFAPIEVPEAILGQALMEMRAILDDNKRARNLQHLKAGRVNRRALGKRAPLQDPRLFQKKIIPAKKDYFVLIGLDVSGSTRGGNRLELLKAAGAAQAELCHRLGIKFSLYAHTGGLDDKGGAFANFDTVDIWQIKQPHEQWDNRAKSKLASLRSGAMNLDGHTLEYYRKVCDRQQETDKIIMYYSDGGMPAENYDEELEILQREIQICKQKQYTLMGVGVWSDAPTEYGLDTVEIRAIQDIKKVVTHLRNRLER